LTAGLGMTSASAGSVAFNFGSLGANGGAVCSANCVLPNQAENFFTTGGVTVGAIGFNSAGAVEFVTQKPGAIDGPGETGLGESSTGINPSDSDYEITDSTYLLIDDAAARAAGYSITSFEMQSIQFGEGGKIYGYTGPLTSISTANLTLLDTLTNPPPFVTQTFSPSASQQYDYYVFQADTPPGGPLLPPFSCIAASHQYYVSFVSAGQAFYREAVLEPPNWPRGPICLCGSDMTAVCALGSCTVQTAAIPRAVIGRKHAMGF
jgi:hypothetical protein